jgi:hypothetical protein
MRFCDECAQSHGFRRTITQEKDTCELCGAFRDCNVQSDPPPMPPEQLKKLFLHGEITHKDGNSVIEIRTDT